MYSNNAGTTKGANMLEMTANEARAYAIGKDAYRNGENLDDNLDWACAEGIVPDTLAVDRFARMGYAGAEMAALAAA
ncbi:hypothetical protein I5H03_gp015 [Mycobacterium phage Nibb]|uniref:Uncharacterized protein n=1 Tax=Mycobacterium phage Nibb TaxID=2510585 RepID=A0A411B5L6_9CAUD|nr:hypothetical protein I5H03_gp015 [Mycobacterium phage Nibb]QAX95631.1 hypothetical protein SEA_NIBB_92 [Mycobacterium phage Nibb]